MVKYNLDFKDCL